MLTTLTLLAAVAVAYLNLLHHREMATLTPEERAEFQREVIADLGIL